MPGAERTDIVARHQLAAALADQVDFEFRMMVPARQFIGIVMFEPAKAMFWFGQDHLKFRRAVLEQGGGADGHGAASCEGAIAPKYPHWQSVR